jgi:hypothetical protein
LAEIDEDFLHGGALDEFWGAKGLCSGASGTNRAEVQGPVATAAEVFNRRHFAGAKLALSLRSLDDLPLGTLRNAAIPHRESAPNQPPKSLAKYGLLLRF